MSYFVEFVFSIEISDLPPHTIRLKPSVVVVLIKNLYISNDLLRDSNHYATLLNKSFGHSVFLLKA